MYDSLKSLKFGMHLMDCIELSSMQEQDSDGFYKSYGRFSVRKIISDSPLSKNHLKIQKEDEQEQKEINNT